ncbi:hypothetical protein CALCODRAFT_497008 [Calocera cornea HHB12733]|uniref:Uncharacterized protein n=1 Tax=Calocera cornea HHB12733 TaxID=1353952 RepID=A0A165FJ93_9BASI|nr:hypothetical protein CALCODRAFT_497008 [Calocera cornea HHB12733]
MASARPTRPSASRPRSLFTPQALHTLSSSLPRTSTLRQAASRPTPPGVNENLARRSLHARSTTPPPPPPPIPTDEHALPPLPPSGPRTLEEEEGDADPPPAYTPRPHSSEASVSFGPLRPWGRPFLPFPDLPPPPAISSAGGRSSSLSAALEDLRPPPSLAPRHQQTASDPLLPSRRPSLLTTTTPVAAADAADEPPTLPTLPWEHDAAYDSDGSFHSFHSAPSAPSLPSGSPADRRSPFLPSPAAAHAQGLPSPLGPGPGQHPSLLSEHKDPHEQAAGSTSSAGSWAPPAPASQGPTLAGLGLGMPAGWASSPSLLSSVSSPTPTGPTGPAHSPSALSQSQSQSPSQSHSATSPARPAGRPPRAQKPAVQVRVPPAPAWLDEALYTASPSLGSPRPPTAAAAPSHAGRTSSGSRCPLPPGAAPPSPMTAFGVAVGGGGGRSPGWGEPSPRGWESEGASPSGFGSRSVGGEGLAWEHPGSRAAAGGQQRLPQPQQQPQQQQQQQQVRERTTSGRDERWLAWERLLAATRQGPGSGRSGSVRVLGSASVDVRERRTRTRTMFEDTHVDRREVFEGPHLPEQARELGQSAANARAGSAGRGEDGPSALPVVGRPLMHRGCVLCYPEGYNCHKCSNTGYKAFDPSHPCRKCWQRYGRPFVAPLTTAPRGQSFQRPLPLPPPKPAPKLAQPKRAGGGSLVGAWPESGERGRFAGPLGSAFVFPKAAPPKTPVAAAQAGVIFPVPAPPAPAAAARERDVYLQREARAAECDGRCAGCDGTGAISVLFFDDEVCPTCRGTGMVFLSDAGQ